MMGPKPSPWTLTGRTALVTGGTRGIGRGIAEELAQLGASVYVCARSEDELQQRLREWKDAGLPIAGSVCDISSYQACEQLVAKASQHFQGKLHILVLNAAMGGPSGPILDAPIEDVALTMRTNFESAVHLSRLAHPLLKGSEAGSVVLISSIAGSQALGPHLGIYHCTKGALNQLTKNLAFEWAKDGIRVNTIAPGYILTDNAILLGDEILGAVNNIIPMRRLGDVHEIAAAVAFLCMPCSNYTTGSIFTIDGGVTCHHSYTGCPSIQPSCK